MNIFNRFLILSLFALAACNVTYAESVEKNSAKSVSEQNNIETKSIDVADKKDALNGNQIMVHLKEVAILGGIALIGYFFGHRNGYRSYEDWFYGYQENVAWVVHLREHLPEQLDFITNRLMVVKKCSYEAALNAIFHVINKLKTLD